MTADIQSPDPYKRIRWDGSRSPHYEVWYTTLNHVNSGAGFWIRYLFLVTPGAGLRAQVWFTAFLPESDDHNLAVAHRYEASQFSGESDPFRIQVGPCSLGPGRMTGMLDAGGIPVVWDLVYDAVTDPLVFLPEAFYKTPWIRTKLVVPHPYLQIGGKIQIANRTFLLNGDPGQQGHVWGTRHAAEWIWFHCSSFTEENGDSVPGYVAGVSARQRMGPLLLPPLSFGHLVWKDQHIPLRPDSRWEDRWDGPWEWRGKLGDRSVQVRLTIPWDRMVSAEYEDPSGGSPICHHTERADCTIHFRSPRRPPVVYSSRAMAHLEIGSRRRDPRSRRSVRYQE